MSGAELRGSAGADGAPAGPPAADLPRTEPPTTAPPPPRAVRRHHPLVRVTHWLTFPLIFAMIASGLQIYGAYPRFGERGGPSFPNPVQDAVFPAWSRLGGWLAGGLNWHFMLMWPLVLVAVVYFAYVLSSGEWRKLLFQPRDVPRALAMGGYYLRLLKEHPPQGKHNALQKLAYDSILLLGVLAVVSGVAMWKPVQLAWLISLLGGYQAARYWHFWTVWCFVGFTLVHVALVLVADPASLRAMLTGRYRGRFSSDEA